MKIKSIEYANFRNFKEPGIIKCSTDGKITIVYGRSGDGKTTLHQLFQWVIYGKTNFNKTATEKLYNFQFESEQQYNSVFEVMGQIDFEHAGEQYFVRRVYKYRKGITDSSKIAEDFSLRKWDNDEYDWRPVEESEKFIEKVLPPGLAAYFFFDGESMIADLRVKGRDSADNLRKALYSMFDLNVWENAIKHIGSTSSRYTVLGELLLSKSDGVNDNGVTASREKMISHGADRDREYGKYLEFKNEKENLENYINGLSEKIGATKSLEEYERDRKNIQARRDVFLKNVEKAQMNFGDAIVDVFPKIFVSKAAENAKEKVKMKAEKERMALPYGITPQLIDYLLEDTTYRCVCGNELGASEKEVIRNYKNMMPPKSYTSLYSQYSHTASMWGHEYEGGKLGRYIQDAADNDYAAHQCEEEIRRIDEEKKESASVANLINDRRKAEVDRNALDEKIQQHKMNYEAYKRAYNKEKKNYDNLTQSLEGNKIVDEKIQIMQEVKQHFEKALENAAFEYSKLLESNIQSLIDVMLTSDRKVEVSNEFSVRVIDNYNDESKSEGQFAVVSFAYIGGILKTLKKEKRLSNKEYPLVLDAPFSKLDNELRQNVVDVLPEFAPQVIIFSKDNLHGVIAEENIGRVWTIISNEDQNVATVEEGKLLWR